MGGLKIPILSGLSFSQFQHVLFIHSSPSQKIGFYFFFFCICPGKSLSIFCIFQTLSPRFLTKYFGPVWSGSLPWVKQQWPVDRKKMKTQLLPLQIQVHREVIPRNVILIRKPMDVFYTHYFFNCFIPDHLKATGTLEKPLVPLGRNCSSLHFSLPKTNL